MEMVECVPTGGGAPARANPRRRDRWVERLTARSTVAPRMKRGACRAGGRRCQGMAYSCPVSDVATATSRYARSSGGRSQQRGRLTAMCGIVAIYSPDGIVSPETLARATARLHHRGPDAQRQWIAPHGRVGLGHARLSIIDLVT